MCRVEGLSSCRLEVVATKMAANASSAASASAGGGGSGGGAMVKALYSFKGSHNDEVSPQAVLSNNPAPDPDRSLSPCSSTSRRARRSP